jgi:UDP-N-acetylglucosamine 2-epimerase (non-hydrolysing)
VTVVGDVNSTMACTLVAAKMQIPVCHVEAGLRSFDRSMPEEVNRVVTDALSDLLLVSEPEGTMNLRREGVPDERVRYVGNVMIDSLVAELESARALSVHESLGLPAHEYAYVTLHRPSNVDDPDRLRHIVRFLEDVARLVPVVFPVHPRTRERLEASAAWARASAIPDLYLLDPLGYRESLGMMAAARLVLTDSAGIQEETSYLHIPCLTLRPNTERPVTVTLGTNTVVGDDLAQARRLVGQILSGRYATGEEIPGWDGRAAVRIVDAIAERYQVRPTARAAVRSARH